MLNILGHCASQHGKKIVLFKIFYNYSGNCTIVALKIKKETRKKPFFFRIEIENEIGQEVWKEKEENFATEIRKQNQTWILQDFL